MRGDFGHSFTKSLAVRTIYFERLPNSLKLGLAAFAISMLLGVPLGMLSALKANTWWDSFGKMFALLGLSMPGFFVGLVLVIIFGVELGWLPVLGKGQSAFVWGDAVHLGGVLVSGLAIPRHAGVCPGLVLLWRHAAHHALEHAGGDRQRLY